MRAQTTLDFAIGVAVFIVTVSFVLAFVPGMFQPFTGSSQENTVAGDRIATDLATSLLVESTHDDSLKAYVLNRTCTTAFFDTGTSPPSGCAYDGTTLAGRVGIDSSQPLNVTIRRDTNGDGVAGVLCWDGNDNLIERGTGTCATPAYAVGDTPGGQTVTLSQRLVGIDGRDAWLEVRLWA